MKRLLRAYTLLLIVLIYVPIIVMVVYSFNDSRYIGEWKGFTTRWYGVVLGDERAWQALRNSLVVAVASALISTAIALPAAFSARRRERGIAQALVYPPVVIPEIAEAVALLLMFVYLGFPLGALSVLVGHTAFNVAYAYIALEPLGHEGSRLAQAARTLGASRLTAFLRVTLPLAMPGIVAALALTFMMSFTDFIKTLFTKGPGFETITILIWNRARRPGLTEYSSQTALAALSSILIIGSLAIAVAYTLYDIRRQRRGMDALGR